ncbi:uncharacterized protein N7446_010547 [Penicillium canescens]|uniref:Uncharacterized protein n=1 Tax=Penicillium canescens TaxID=5083 RepID=A0AAD6IBR8_PENCN|nr:uncharacterized protein N7446_010547 [Penicillium canescens]KAJ6041570.1 hypothetical protein N7460_006960 [Penicillium canescens]KAJ6050438.1 hypothetical protein N7446_010547 [Penicillium canescens]KAJ6064741.1 hypothetical protein N7444_000394 [Penicillium canescens]
MALKFPDSGSAESVSRSLPGIGSEEPIPGKLIGNELDQIDSDRLDFSGLPQPGPRSSVATNASQPFEKDTVR